VPRCKPNVHDLFQIRKVERCPLRAFFSFSRMERINRYGRYKNNISHMDISLYIQHTTQIIEKLKLKMIKESTTTVNVLLLITMSQKTVE
jgi:hypothetical protein